MRYLSGPPDARANYRVQDPRTGLWYAPTDEMRAAAEAEYLEAKCRGRLPDMQWTHKLPRLKVSPDELQHLLPLAAD
ncbi:hypothetical protein [Deinococcus apachensis]|uniref:hypothetical protein n=1 Tax=Deinococcus apachensis TaxID=309886 RepID=UPI0003690F76|nr:hypothetical protein [Deinococcus apachensis]